MIPTDPPSYPTPASPGLRIGYARVSTHEQNLALQEDALRGSGCQRIFSDRISGSRDQRPGLERVMDVLRAGDTLVVWRLDRLGRSLSHLVELVERLEQGQIALQSLQEQIDTSGSAGRLVFHLFASLAEFERGLLRERTLAGLASARARGRLGGRPHKLSASEMAQAHALYVSKAVEVAAICQTFGISKSTFYRYLNIGNWPDDRSSSSKRG